tara:strand:- start:450 stop:1442 length:993 start_codon:yes stop_codon:yes gene_type:complete
MKNQKVYIIGGSGFIGTSLSKLFNKKKIQYTSCDLHQNPIAKKNLRIDIENTESLINFSDANVIINLAAIHRDDVYPLSRYDDVNIQGAVNICEVARIHKIHKIIFTSSVAIYGFAPPGTDESGKPNYFNDYGRSKFLAEQVYKKWQAEDPGNRTLVIVRPTVVFGEGNRGNVYNLLNQVAQGRFVMFGKGQNRKSMAYVENVASFLDYSLSFKPGLHIYNYIDKPDFDMNTLVCEARKVLFGKNNVGFRLPEFLGISIGYFADLVAKITSKKLPISSIRVKKFMGITQFSSSVSETDFLPPFSLKEGLTRTLRYEFLEDNSDKKTFEAE